RLRGVVVEIASDVDNPLCGPHGASHTFGPQKGATPEQVRQLDAALAHMAEIVTRAGHPDQRAAPGAGAAGGLGYAALAFLSARLRPGVEIVAELGQLAQAVAG
ncbi:glycerate kinase, partial [Acinetobacter baumannii]